MASIIVWLQHVHTFTFNKFPISERLSSRNSTLYVSLTVNQ